MFTRRFLPLIASLALLAGLPAAAAPTPEPGSARVWLTAKDTSDRLTPKGAVSFQDLAQPEESAAVVFVDPGHAFQVIEGIGGALTDASAETFARLDPARQQELLTAYFDREKGIGYSLARTHIHSCDFSSGSYTYVKDGDEALASFSIAPDLKYRIPFLKAARKVAPDLKLFVSPWSPPAWMKTNGNMLKGGRLLPQFSDAWARYFVRFIQEYEKQGLPIWGLTVQNEPMAVQTWESCLFTGDEEREFVKRHLGPTLRKAGLGDRKLMIWDHNRALLYQRAQAVLDDPQAAQYVWGVGFHWYVGDQFAAETQVHEAWPDKALFFTEGCNYPFSWDTFEQWHWGEKYGHNMINDFNNWTAGWCDWNVLLDDKGGPNHVANYCFAPIHADAQGNLRYMNSYYYLGHFSKFVRPGARRVACTTSKDDLEATAFRNPDGSVATVVMNATDAARDAWVRTGTRAVKVALPAHSIATVVW